ncbi:bifunctional diaminohydroxyphosphoribosylaminopyrimidine deaminase/5-amino-6-(5-phosphoribosylamino)uracil reductase RibD [bacterium]|nr:bifunctional diaminohydroxyphosphoribosylaminopyrimidine deaminase/5-amino-6-(5-phosphoribosylamino)uracil reductase RibD [bacterium]
MENLSFDTEIMKRLLEIAGRRAYRTRPNPPAVAALVQRGTIISIGLHRGPGTPHAEIDAIGKAGEKADGATLYVTLEPCTHSGGTPPCVDAIRKARIRRVVFPILDANPLVRANPAIPILENAGIAVYPGILPTMGAISNAEFLTHISNKRPFITGKAGMSLDGKIALSSGESTYITGSESLKMAHRLRAEADGILVGIGTVLSDNPRLSVRNVPYSKAPRKIILDSMARLPLNAALFENTSPENVVVVVGSAAPEDRVADLRRYATVIRLSAPHVRDRWAELLSELYRYGFFHVLIEGGEQVMTSAIDANCVDRLFVMIAPTLLGGKSSFSFYGGAGVSCLAEQRRLRHVRYQPLGHDMMVAGFLNDPFVIIQNLED